MRFLRDDNTGAYGAVYTGGVNDDITQNAIPIATNTILIISYLHLFGLRLGSTPGWSRDFTLIYYTRIGNKILKWPGLESYPSGLAC
jgi:hypothetical protein